jgi:hypothetical protein
MVPVGQGVDVEPSATQLPVASAVVPAGQVVGVALAATQMPVVGSRAEPAGQIMVPPPVLGDASQAVSGDRALG